MNSVRVPRSPCPYCGYAMDAVSGVGHTKPAQMPQPGDYSACITCAQMLVFDLDLRHRKPTEDEKQAVLADPVLARFMRRLQAAIRELARRRNQEDRRKT